MEIRSPFDDIAVTPISLPEFVFTNFVRYTGQTAVVDDCLNKRYSYDELRTTIDKFSQALWRRGVRKGDRVCAYLPNCVEYPVVLMGIISLGATIVVANSTLTPNELKYIIEESDANIIVTYDGPEYSRVKLLNMPFEHIIVVDGKEGTENFDSLIEEGSFGDQPHYTPPTIEASEDIAWIGFTSGTTGKPKGTMHTHQSFVTQIRGWIAMQVIESADVFMPNVAYFGIFGTAGILKTLFIGATLIVIPFGSKATTTLPIINKYKVTVIISSPNAIHEMCDYIQSENIVPPTTVREWHYGGTVSPTNTPTRLRDILHVQSPRDSYGATELISITYTEKTGRFDGSVGVLNPSVQAKIIDLNTKEPLEAKGVGEIYIRSQTVMKGYLNDPEATDAVIDRQGWFHTGDVGYHDGKGSLFITGRCKDILEVNGAVVSPAELESCLMDHPSVIDAAVVGAPTSGLNDLPCAFVTLKPGCSATEKEIIDYVAAAKAPYKHLTGGVRFIDVIPRSLAGKIQKADLVGILKRETKNIVPE